MGSVLIERATVARAHEELRFLEPAHWAAEMCTVDCENLKRFGIDAADPARNVRGLSIPRLALRVSIDCEPGLAFREPGERPERDPTGFRLAAEARERVSNERHAHERGGDAVQRGSDLEKKVAAGHSPRRRTIFESGFLAGTFRILFVHWSFVPLCVRLTGSMRCAESHATTSEISCGAIPWA